MSAVPLIALRRLFRGSLRLLCVCAALGVAVATAQDQTPPLSAEQARILLLRGKLEDLKKRDEEVATLRKKLQDTTLDADTLAQTKQRLEDAEKLRRTLAEGFHRDVSGVGEITEEESGAELDITHELKEVIKPALEELKGLTEQPRRIDELRREIARREREITRLKVAVEGLDTTVAQVARDAEKEKNSDLSAWVAQERRDSAQRADDLAKEAEVLRRQLDEVSSRQSVTAKAAKEWSWFVLERLFSLLLALAAAVGTLLLLRMIWRALRRRRVLEKMHISPFLARLCDVFFYSMSTVTAVFAGFTVLYFKGDWLLLTLAMLVVAGLAFVSRNTLPKFYDEAKLLLNVGAVREGERVFWQGLPWLVKRLHFYSTFENPALTGGYVRLPLRDLVPLASRPYSPKERWFPTSEGDWVELNDGTVGKVVLQTPDMVQVVPVGGSLRTYTIPDFLQRAPRDLSHSFRITAKFPLHHRHIGAATEEIPGVLREALTAACEDLTGPDGFKHLSVELGHAGESSLDFIVLADFSGAAAPHYVSLPWLIQRVCVRTAAEHGWTIPYRQIVVHSPAENGGAET